MFYLSSNRLHSKYLRNSIIKKIVDPYLKSENWELSVWNFSFLRKNPVFKRKGLTHLDWGFQNIDYSSCLITKNVTICIIMLCLALFLLERLYPKKTFSLKCILWFFVCSSTVVYIIQLSCMIREK